mgnify:FL=1|tara:strand:+ start:136 stop:432 length:297 start_codon:yes stop_codon:yes gene_type:complete
MNHAMHPNSLLAYELERLNLTKRKAQVYSLVYDYQHNGHTVTDRQVMTALGYSDMNSVRPRLTELIKMGALLEGQSITCPVTHKTVRTILLPSRQGGS